MDQQSATPTSVYVPLVLVSSVVEVYNPENGLPGSVSFRRMHLNTLSTFASVAPVDGLDAVSDQC